MVNSLVLRILLHISDLGEGWNVARLNDKAEYDFIRQAQRGWSHDRNYFIYGLCVGSPSCLPGSGNRPFDFSNYAANSSENLILIHLIDI